MVQVILSDEHDQEIARRRQAVKDEARRRIEPSIARLENTGEFREARAQRWVLDSLIEDDNPYPYHSLIHLVRVPVTIEEFAQSPDFVGVLDDFQVWPSWRQELRRMCPDVFTGQEAVHEIVLGGASGTGKTTVAQIVLAYQIYLLSCFRRPSDPFPSLSSLTPIIFPLMSHNYSITRNFIYEPLRSLLTSMPYVRKYMTWDKNRESALVFTSHNIHLEPKLAMVASLKGQAVCGAIVDELSSMKVIEQSKQVPGPRGLGGKFDQASLIHRDTMNRRQRSFKTRGVSPGTCCFLSQTMYQGDFLDQRLDTLEEEGRPNTYHLRLKRHEMNPEDRAEMRAGRTMRVLVGSPGHSTRVIKDGDKAGRDYPKDAKIELVPAWYEHLFLDDPDGQLREVCGISTGVISPFIPNRESIARAFDRGDGLEPWVLKQNVLLHEDGLPEWVTERIPPEHRDDPHFIHIDLSISKDRCGVAIAKVRGLVHVEDPENPSTIERAPHIVVPVAISIQPRPTHQIDPGEIRTWLVQLGSEYGLNIGGVSYDGFQSHESIMRWRNARVPSRLVGLDRDSEVYTEFRRGLSQDRIDLVWNDVLSGELHDLEYNAQKDKVDHPPKGSKDIADAVAGACHLASRSRTYRGQQGYVDPDSGERTRLRSMGGRKKGGSRPLGTKRRRK